jgi:threonine synthase
MQFIETRGNDGKRPAKVPFSQAILNPMASFGGLYVPEQLPELGMSFLEAHRDSSYKTIAKAVLDAYEIDIDAAVIDQALSLYDKFDDGSNPVPVVKIGEKTFVSELFHGPTRAFKDMALQPFGVVLSSLAQARNENYLILAATSGDTGPATLETFKNRDNVKVACLYPDGGTSDVQRLQMVTEDAANLKVIGIHGDFDDAQSALKSLLSSDAFHAKLAEKGTKLSAANSVNFGRIIFQQIYHISSYLDLVRQGAISLGDEIYINVPSGNFGNALGGYYAMKMGLPIARILISSNSNNVLTDLIKTGAYDLTGRSVIATTSPAMDILKSSNVERVLFDLFGAERTRELMAQLDSENQYQLSDSELAQLQAIFGADYASDEEVARYIKETFEDGYLMCPHTATCFKAQETQQNDHATVIYATAEWTKFSPTVAETITGEAGKGDEEALQLISEASKQPVPPMIAALFNKPVAQDTVINKTDIEETVFAFI